MTQVSHGTLFIVGLALAFALPLVPIAHWVAPGSGPGPQLIAEAVWWLIGVGALLWLTKIEGAPLQTIGLRRPTASTIGWGVLFVIPLMASVLLCFALILPALGLKQDLATAGTITRLPVWLQIAMFIRAGVVEEILYRGYAIERLRSLTGRRWLAVGLAVAGFVLLHATSWAVSQLIVVAFGALILSGLYVWKRDLSACMIAHALTDIVGFTLAQQQP